MLKEMLTIGLFMWVRWQKNHLPPLSVSEWMALSALYEIRGAWTFNVIAKRVASHYPLCHHLIDLTRTLSSMRDKIYVMHAWMDVTKTHATYTITDEGRSAYHAYLFAMDRATT